jgi:hypothetical protein
MISTSLGRLVAYDQTASLNRGKMVTLSEYAFTWHTDLLDREAFTYKGVDLLEMEAVDAYMFFTAHSSPRPLNLKRWAKGALPPLALRFFPQAFHQTRSLLTAYHRRRLARPPKDGKGQVLVLPQSWTASFLGTLMPVLRHLEREGPYSPLILTSEVQVQRRLARDGLPFVTYEDYTPYRAEHTRQLRRYQAALAEARRRLEAAPTPNAMLLSMVRRGFFELLARRALLLTQLIDALERLLELERVVALLTAADVHALGKTATVLCNGRNIPTLVLQHGLMGEGEDAMLLGFVPPVARWVCVWGEGPQRVFLRHGVEKERIVVTGQPRFDRLLRFRQTGSKQDVFQELEAPPGARLVTFASQTVIRTPADVDRLLEMLRVAGQAVPEAFFLIKLHPAEDRRMYQRRQAALQVPRVKIAQEIDLYRALQASDVAMTIFSTAGLEALALGKRLIVLTCFARAEDATYVERGAALAADTGEQLAIALQRALGDPAWQEKLKTAQEAFVADQLCAVDGRSTARVVQAIEQAVAHASRTSSGPS